MNRILGLHHMTAICGDAQSNIDFYTGTLGLRLVKVTVNFDDPTAYHLYYGDGAGNPGTLLTFFPYPTAMPGRPGKGQATITSLSIPTGSMDYWRSRLGDAATPGVQDGTLDLTDPDGILLRLIEDPKHRIGTPWERSTVPERHQIGGIHSITLSEEELERTALLLMRVLGFEHDEDAEVPEYVFLIGDKGPGKRVDVSTLGYGSGRPGRGTVHHIAFRTPDDDTQAVMREELTKVGAQVSDVRDRDYFRSIYFREPGGVLFEIATDPPGFTVDEDLDSLGTRLCLPAIHEPKRAMIEATLPKLNFPNL